MRSFFSVLLTVTIKFDWIRKLTCKLWRFLWGMVKNLLTIAPSLWGKWSEKLACPKTFIQSRNPDQIFIIMTLLDTAAIFKSTELVFSLLWLYYVPPWFLHLLHSTEMTLCSIHTVSGCLPSLHAVTNQLITKSSELNSFSHLSF